MTISEKYRAMYWENDAVYNLFAEASGLNRTEFMTVYCIATGVDTQAAICKMLFMPKQTVHSAVLKLQKQGIVEKSPTENNLKSKKLSLTEYGKEFAKNKVLKIDAIDDEVWELFSEKESEKLLALTEKYNEFFKSKVYEYLKNIK